MTGDERTVVLGGTFTPIHDGHRALLHKAFQTADHHEGDGHVIIGLTSSDLARQTRSNPEHAEMLGSFDERRRELESELERWADAYTADYEIQELEDPRGPAMRPDVDALVVSPEGKAQHRAHELNEQRVRDGDPPIEIHTAPFVIAEDGVRISSTRIRNGEIDAHGNLLDGG